MSCRKKVTAFQLCNRTALGLLVKVAGFSFYMQYMMHALYLFYSKNKKNVLKSVSCLTIALISPN